MKRIMDKLDIIKCISENQDDERLSIINELVTDVKDLILGCDVRIEPKIEEPSELEGIVIRISPNMNQEALSQFIYNYMDR